VTRPRRFACSYYSTLTAPCQCARTPYPDVVGAGQGRDVRERLDDTEYSGSASTEMGQQAVEPTIVIEDEGLRLGFTQLPNYLFQVRGLSHSAKLTYALILSYAWQKDYCFPGQETLARDLEVSTRSVIEYLKELQARGLIRIQRRGLGKTNVYHVLRYPPVSDHPAPHPTPTPGPSRARHGASHPEVKRASHQGLTSTSPLDARGTSHPEVHDGADQEVRESAGNKKTPPAKNTNGKNQSQQRRAAAPGRTTAKEVKGARNANNANGVAKAQDVTITPIPQNGLFSDLTDRPPDVAMARAALQAHGIRGERLLTELAAEPGEALAQIERLRQEVARGAVANPAGWLVEAIRGRYRLIDEDDAPEISGGQTGVTAGAPVSHDAPAATTPEGQAWARVCAEVRGDITPENYGRWVAPVVPQDYTGDQLIVGVSDLSHQHWLDRRLRRTIERAAARALGDVTVTFVVAGRA